MQIQRFFEIRPEGKVSVLFKESFNHFIRVALAPGP